MNEPKARAVIKDIPNCSCDYCKSLTLKIVTSTVAFNNISYEGLIRELQDYFDNHDKIDEPIVVDNR